MTYSKRQAQLLSLKTVPMSPRPKRSLEAPITNDTKKRRTLSLPKRSIERIEEEPEEETSTPIKNKKNTSPVFENSGRKRKTSKAFQEDDSWE